jgi:hypothetical protein
VLRLLAPVLWPLAVAGVLAYLLDPVVDFLERKGLRRQRAILTVFGLALLIAVGFLGSVVPQLVNESRQLVARIPAYAARAELQLQEWVDNPPPLVKKILEHQRDGTETPPTPSTPHTPPSAALTNAPAAPTTASSSPALDKSSRARARSSPRAVGARRGHCTSTALALTGAAPKITARASMGGTMPPFASARQHQAMAVSTICPLEARSIST